MGLFCLPVDLNDPEIFPKDPTPEQLVDAAIVNLQLWKDNQDCDYLISTFAMGQLEQALTKLRLNDPIRGL
jgi:hypothetical protein